VKGRGGLDHSGVITLLEDLAASPGEATVDRAGLDPQGRLPKVQIRRFGKAICRRSATSWSRPSAISSSASSGRARARHSAARSTSTIAGSWSRGAAFVAEEDSSKIVGAALAVTWGAVGVLGPVAVLTNYHNQTIGQS